MSFGNKLLLLLRPIAASAAATVNIKRVKICPDKSFKNIEKATN